MRKEKIFLAYAPVGLLVCQILANILWFVDKSVYYKTAFYFNALVGSSLAFAIVLVLLTYLFKFCSVSRYAAIAQILFAINYLIVQQDNLYNIMFQIIIGLLAIIATFWHYVKKFPLCRLSLFTGFIASSIKKGSCKKGLEEWDRNVKSIILKQHHKNHGQRNLR